MNYFLASSENVCHCCLQEKFENIKGVIGSRKSKDRQNTNSTPVLHKVYLYREDFKVRVINLVLPHRVRVMVFNAISNNMSVISWWSVLLMEETEVLGESQRSVTSHWQALSHKMVLSTLRHEWDLNSQL